MRNLDKILTQTEQFYTKLYDQKHRATPNNIPTNSSKVIDVGSEDLPDKSCLKTNEE